MSGLSYDTLATMELYTLEALSERLGGVPLSTLKHRIAQLGIPASARGSRNKLLFDERAAALIEASDQLLREGHGLVTTRRMLGLEGEGEGEIEGMIESVSPEPDLSPLDRLSRALETALRQTEDKDRQIMQLQDELRRSAESAATYQQKVFYLQAELQRVKEELKEAFKAQKGWKALFSKREN